MTLPMKRPRAMSKDLWKEYEAINRKFPWITFPYLSSPKKVASTSTYSFTIYRPDWQGSLSKPIPKKMGRLLQKERHVIFKGSSNADMLILCLPPILQEELLATWQSTWPSLSLIHDIQPQEDIIVAVGLKKSIVRAVIRSIHGLI